MKKNINCKICIWFGVRDCCGAFICEKGWYDPISVHGYDEDTIDKELEELSEGCEDFEPYKEAPKNKKQRKRGKK